MNKIIVMISSLLLLSLIGCSSNTEKIDLNNYNLNQPKDIIKIYFASLNNHDENTLKKVITKDASVLYTLDEIKSVKILDIKDDIEGDIKDSYLKYGIGSAKKTHDVIGFEVNYKIKYKKGGSDEDRRFIVLIKEGENSQWLIDSVGKV